MREHARPANPWRAVRDPALGLALLALLAMTPAPAMAQQGWWGLVDAWPEAPWAERLTARLESIEAGYPGKLGVHVRDLETGARVGWRDDEAWYLASLVKVPVAIELLARVEAGEMALDDRLTLQRSDYVDGAGPTNWEEPGTRLTLRELLEPMLIVSDNTATDMLIHHLGLEAVNRRAQQLVPLGGLGPITRLVDVRRHAYANLHPAAFTLGGLDFIELSKREGDAARLAWLRQRLELERHDLRVSSVDAAFRAYYISELNSGRLDAFAELLAALAEGRALGPVSTAELLAIMGRTASGEQRLKAGLGRDVHLAHKTGTQHRLACDAGIAIWGEVGDIRRLVIVACVRGELDLALNEQTLAAIGEAIRAAGALARP